MGKLSEIFDSITGKHGHVLDLNKNPEILMDIITQLRIHEPEVFSGGQSPAAVSAPFGVSWMDSWAANWMLHQPSVGPGGRPSPEEDFKVLLRQLTDLKFNQRLKEIRSIITGVYNEPPDGGSEPGVGPVGPGSIFSDEPEPPDGGTPEPGVPNPPPDPGPDGGILRENPWILYWFVSINAPLILEMIDVHFNRRLDQLAQQVGVGK